MPEFFKLPLARYPFYPETILVEIISLPNNGAVILTGKWPDKSDSTRDFSFASSPFPSSSSFLFESLKHLPCTFQDLCLILLCPFLSCWKLKQIDRAKPKYRVNILQRGFLRRQQAADLYSLLSSVDAANMTSCSMERFGTAKLSCAMILWLLSPKLPYAVYWMAQLAGGCSVHPPSTPASSSSLQFEPPAEKKYFFLCFLLLALAYQYQQT